MSKRKRFPLLPVAPLQEALRPSRTMYFSSLARLALPALPAQSLHLKISRATPPASAAILVHASSGHSAVADVIAVAIAVADAQIAAVAVPTAVAVDPIAAVAPAAVVRDSSAAAPVGQGTTVVIKEAVPVPRAVRSSSPKC